MEGAAVALKKKIIAWDSIQQILIFSVNETIYKVKFFTLTGGNRACYFFNQQESIVLAQAKEHQKKSDDISFFISGLKSPLDGMVIKVMVSEGQQITKGDPLVVIEAMKMENILYAPCAAIIKSLFITVGNVVHHNQDLMSFTEIGKECNARTDNGRYE